jgi:hypothetical protein
MSNKRFCVVYLCSKEKLTDFMPINRLFLYEEKLLSVIYLQEKIQLI